MFIRLSRRKRQLLLFAFMLALTCLFASLLYLNTIHSPGQGQQAALNGSAKLGRITKQNNAAFRNLGVLLAEFLNQKRLLQNTHSPVYAKLPGLWNNLTIDGKNLPGFGYGTYRLRLSGLKEGQQIALYVPVLAVSYELYADDLLLTRNGVFRRPKTALCLASCPRQPFLPPGAARSI